LIFYAVKCPAKKLNSVNTSRQVDVDFKYRYYVSKDRAQAEGVEEVYFNLFQQISIISFRTS
jgi:hypothetical protein